MRKESRAILGLLSAWALSSAAGAEPVVFFNARVFTASDSSQPVDAFAVDGGKFVATGTRRHVDAMVGPHARHVDLKDHFVVPGLSDDHFHGEGGGPGVSLARARSISDVEAALRTGVARASAGSMVITNSDWHEAQLVEDRLPTIKELDAISATVPIVIMRGGHSLFLNSAALTKFGITPQTPVPAGGSIPRNPDGTLTGEITDRAKVLVPLPPEPPLSEAALETTQHVMNRYGITSVRVPGAGKGPVLDLITVARRMEKAGTLSLRYTVLRAGPGFAGGTLEALKRGPQQGDGDDWVKIDGVKIAVDGGFEGAHFSQPYAEPYGKGGTYFGISLTPRAKIVSDVVAMSKDGWHVAVHAAGDEGIEDALEAFEAADRISPIKGKRWAIEHAFIPRDDQILRMKKLGVVLSLQDHMYLGARSMQKLWGKERTAEVTPVRRYMEAGLLVAGGTDSPVIPPNPFWVMYHFASRDTMNAGVEGLDQRVTSRSDLIRMFTINYAKLIGEDARRGSIEPGKLADFAVLDTNLLQAPLPAIRDAKALATFVGGREVWSDGSVVP